MRYWRGKDFDFDFPVTSDFHLGIHHQHFFLSSDSILACRAIEGLEILKTEALNGFLCGYTEERATAPKVLFRKAIVSIPVRITVNPFQTIVRIQFVDSKHGSLHLKNEKPWSNIVSPFVHYFETPKPCLFYPFLASSTNTWDCRQYENTTVAKKLG